MEADDQEIQEAEEVKVVEEKQQPGNKESGSTASNSFFDTMSNSTLV